MDILAAVATVPVLPFRVGTDTGAERPHFPRTLVAVLLFGKSRLATCIINAGTEYGS
jgi:hypothetical protein